MNFAQQTLHDELDKDELLLEYRKRIVGPTLGVRGQINDPEPE